MRITKEAVLKREFAVRFNVEMLARYLQELGMQAEAEQMMRIHERFDGFFFAIKDKLLERIKEVNRGEKGAN